MNKRFSDHVTPGLIGFVAACAALLLAPRADAAAELRWTQSGSGVAGYRIHFGPAQRMYTTTVDIGFVAPGPDGVSSFPLQGVITTPSYVAMTAYGSTGLESDFSNEIWVEPPAGCSSDADCPAPGQCQVGFCDSVLGCGSQNLPDGSACDDGNAATTGDQCMAGTCGVPPQMGGSVSLVSIMPSAPSGVVGDPYTFVVSATSNGTPLFRWLVKLGDGHWSVLRDYNSNPMMLWTPQTAGDYSIAVSAKTAGAAAEQDFILIPYHVDAAAGSGVRFTVEGAEPTDVLPRGVPVVLDAQGGPGQEYRFLLYYRGRPWRVLRNFSSDPSFVWLPLGRPGTYEVGVQVRNAGESQPLGDDTSIVELVDQPLVECAANAGVVTCSTPPSGGELEYKWWVRGPRTRWQVLHAYGEMGDTISFTPNNGAGQYAVSLWARPAEGSELAKRYGQGRIYRAREYITP